MEMEPWRWAWREGFAKVLSDNALAALKKGLFDNDPRLLQGKTTEPLPLEIYTDKPVCGACGIAYAIWQGDCGGDATVSEIEKRFFDVCMEVFKAIGDQARPGTGFNIFLNWFDDIGRVPMRMGLYPEVCIEIERRAALTKQEGEHTL